MRLPEFVHRLQRPEPAAARPAGQAGMRLATVLTTATAALLLAACASTPVTGPSSHALLHDQHFQPLALPVQADEVLKLSPEMRRFANEDLMPAGTRGDPRQLLVDAMYRAPNDPRPGNLSLRYEADATRTAAQTFEARAGNCLSLVLMTAAFARHLGVPVRFQSVRVDQSFTRSGALVLSAGHVNLALGRDVAALLGNQGLQWTTVDFLPQANVQRQRHEVLPTATVLAMYMNNRAADALVAGRLDESYAWAREALRQDENFIGGVNTLAVVYLQRGLTAEAEQALQHVLQRAPANHAALSNLLVLLEGAGRQAEAQGVAQRLARLQDHPPFHFHDLGQAALARGDATAARDYFRRELRRQPWQHESHHGLARAYAALGQAAGAAAHLSLAREYGGNAQIQKRYAAKLAQLLAEGDLRVH